MAAARSGQKLVIVSTIRESPPIYARTCSGPASKRRDTAVVSGPNSGGT
jgi:hypothetical protein